MSGLSGNLFINLRGDFADLYTFHFPVCNFSGNDRSIDRTYRARTRRRWGWRRGQRRRTPSAAGGGRRRRAAAAGPRPLGPSPPPAA
ncbi:Os12g0143950, partial [Oryza sativa Japonica Group]